MPVRYLGLLLEYFVWTEATLELLLAVSALLRLDHDELGRVVLNLPDPGPGHGAGDPGAGVLSILRLREGIHSFTMYQITRYHIGRLILHNYLPASESVERSLHPPGCLAGISPA